MWGWNAGMGGWMIFGGIIMLAFWAGIIFLVIWGIRKITERGTTSSSVHTPLDIAKERYARGEITKEQYEQIKKDLS
jgi:putative membrane protein